MRNARQTIRGGATAARSCHIAGSSPAPSGDRAPAGLVSSRAQRRCPYPAPRLEMQQHACVAERVGLYAVQVEKLGDALVIGAQKLAVHLCGDRGAVDRPESVAAEEGHRKSEAEHTINAHCAGPAKQRTD